MVRDGCAAHRGSMATLDRPLALRLLAVAAGAALAAVALGGAAAVAIATTALSGQSDPSGWDRLGVALFALAGAVLAAVIVYPAVVVVGVRRFVPPGHRAATVGMLLATPPVLASALSWAAEAVPPGPAAALAVPAAAGFVVAMAVAILWASGALAPGAAKRVGGGALALAVALVGVSSAV